MTVSVKRLAGKLILTIGTGLLSAAAAGSFGGYGQLNKPPLSPPAGVFPVVWTILYILMAVSAEIAASETPKSDRCRVLMPFYIQLGVNFLWSVIFFRFGLYGLAALWLGFLIIWVTAMISGFRKVSITAASLQIPYLLWCCFALYLNIGVYLLN